LSLFEKHARMHQEIAHDVLEVSPDLEDQGKY
jgi:hypothetical protein